MMTRVLFLTALILMLLAAGKLYLERKANHAPKSAAQKVAVEFRGDHVECSVMHKNGRRAHLC